MLGDKRSDQRHAEAKLQWLRHMCLKHDCQEPAAVSDNPLIASSTLHPRTRSSTARTNAHSAVCDMNPGDLGLPALKGSLLKSIMPPDDINLAFSAIRRVAELFLGRPATGEAAVMEV